MRYQAAMTQMVNQKKIKKNSYKLTIISFNYNIFDFLNCKIVSFKI